MKTNPLVRILKDAAERCIAKDIVRRSYEAQGYDVSNDSIGRYLDTPHATMFGLFDDDEVLYGTISVVIDSAYGFPMDAIYTGELALWRAEGKKLAEVVQFAIEHADNRKSSPFEAAPLFTAVLTHAVSQKVDYLCISINPKHDQFYSLLGFEQIGGLKHYGSVDAPAIARALHVSDWNKNPFTARFFGKEALAEVDVWQASAVPSRDRSR